MERRITVCPRGAPAYPVVVGRGAAHQIAEMVPEDCSRAVWIADDNVAPLHGSRAQQILEAHLPTSGLIFPAGEIHKTRGTKEILEDQLLAAGLGRDSIIVAVGGGVTTDLGGFVASTFLRGIPWIAMPTSLLGAVDASVGGKVGVNTEAGKNIIGAFCQPLGVVIDLDLLATLPAAEVDNGLGEMVKHAVIADAAHLGELVSLGGALRALEPTATLEPIVRSVEIKAEVVGNDPTEADYRQVLNLGHTIAHAIEQLSHYQIAHGRAVAIGLSVEAGIAKRLGFVSEGEADEIRDALSALSLPLTPPPTMQALEIIAATRGDKKGRMGQPRYALPAGIGAMTRGPSGYAHAVDDEVVRVALEELSCSV